MKFRRFLSGLIFGIGCALIFIGILTTLLPSVPNPQLQLVLSSFSMQSSNAFVTLINCAMNFALQQNGRVLLLGILISVAGAGLLLHFMPKQQKQPRPLPSAAVPSADAESSSRPVCSTAAEAEQNPFAVGSYLDQLPLRENQKPSSLVTYTAPILEPNRIENITLDILSEEKPAPVLSADESLYFSHRFETESRAVETERGTPSQSGSSILIRNFFESSPAAEQSVQDTVLSPKTPEDKPSIALQPSEPVSMVPASPRIRTTMGRRSSR